MDFAAARQNMVDCQILPSNVDNEQIIDAMLAVPREAFVPTEMASIAYVDEVLALGQGRFVMEPMVIARLLQEASLRPDDVALSIGCASGYAVAVLAKTVNTVVAVEPDEQLAQKADQALSNLGLDNVAIVDGDLAKGNAAQGPYDVIFFDGAVSQVPDEIAAQLAEGGRLVCIVHHNGVGRAQLTTCHGGALSTRELFDAGTPLLPGFEAEQSFVF